MTRSRTIVAIAALAACAHTAVAQAAAACGWPGAAFGITAYQCASCEFGRDSADRITYTFNAEPVIKGVVDGSVWRPGDIIVSVGAKPITTAEGAASFAYPLESPARIMSPLVMVDGAIQQGSQTRMPITIRRGRAMLVTTQPLAERCTPMRPFAVPRDSTSSRRPNSPSPELGLRARLMMDSLRKFRVYFTDTTELAYILATSPDSLKRLVAARAVTTEKTSRYGFALGCRPSCSRAIARDGSEYWKYDGYPPIVDIRPNSPAEAAGLKIGDQVLEVDGLSILSTDGALRLLSTMTGDSFRLTVMRDGKHSDHYLVWRVRKPAP